VACDTLPAGGSKMYYLQASNNENMKEHYAEYYEAPHYAIFSSFLLAYSSLELKYSLQHAVLKHAQSVLFPLRSVLNLQHCY
jgi:hypothetical protein